MPIATRLRVRTSLSFVAILALAACGGAGTADEAPPAVDVTLEAETIMELDLDWAQRFADRDWDWIADIQAENAVQLPPGSDIIEGREAIQAAWEAMASTIPGLSWEPVMVKVSSGGDMAYIYGMANAVDADGNATPMKYLEVWVKIDGEWKVAVDMFNANAQQRPIPDQPMADEIAELQQDLKDHYGQVAIKVPAQ